MSIIFPFERELSQVFGWVYRPYALVSFWSNKYRNWLDVAMLVDSGADYTLLPKLYLTELGVQQSDIASVSTSGVGGATKVFLLQQKQRVKLGEWERKIPLGFLDSDGVPPLLGRHEFLETFRVTFDRHMAEFDNAGKVA